MPPSDSDETAVDDVSRGDRAKGDRPRRRPRRACAPPTASVAEGASETPDADWGAWLKGDDDATSRSASAQDRWYLEQRPPHWG